VKNVSIVDRRVVVRAYVVGHLTIARLTYLRLLR
jgi:hypothetical protein